MAAVGLLHGSDPHAGATGEIVVPCTYRDVASRSVITVIDESMNRCGVDSHDMKAEIG